MEEFYDRVSRVSNQSATKWLLIVLPFGILGMMSVTFLTKSTEIRYGFRMGISVFSALFLACLLNYWRYRFIRLRSHQVSYFYHAELYEAKLMPYMKHHLNKGMGSMYYGIELWIVQDGTKQKLLYPFLRSDIRIGQKPQDCDLKVQIHIALTKVKTISGSFDANNGVVLSSSLDFEPMLNKIIKKGRKR